MIYLGPAGTGGTSEKGLIIIKENGLKAAEVEFTYSIWMSNSQAKTFGEIAKRMEIRLSIHCPYFINLASKEKHKIQSSKKRILQSCERGHHMKADYIVFHPGFYQKQDPELIYQLIKTEILDMQKTIKHNSWNVILAPETTGKPSQFGDIDELLRLKKDTGCRLCIDFAHLKARNNGNIDYNQIFKKLKPLKHIHAHFSGIEFTSKGEKKHLLTQTKDIKELLTQIKKHRLDITIINESPDPLGDSIKTKKILEDL